MTDMNFAAWVTLFSSISTFLLAVFTFMQVHVLNRAKISISSEFDELYGRYYLVMRNTGSIHCVIDSIKYDKVTEVILKSRDSILPKNCKKYKLLPFQGFEVSTIGPGVSKFCELRPQDLFKDDNYKVSIDVTVKYSYKSFIFRRHRKDKFSVCLSEYLSTRTTFIRAHDLKEAIEFLTRSLNLALRGHI